MAYGRVNVGGGASQKTITIPAMTYTVPERETKIIWEITDNFISFGSQLSQFNFTGFGIVSLDVTTDLETKNFVISSFKFSDTSNSYVKIIDLNMCTIENNKIKISNMTQKYNYGSPSSIIGNYNTFNGKIKKISLKVVADSDSYCEVKIDSNNKIFLIK